MSTFCSNSADWNEGNFLRTTWRRQRKNAELNGDVRLYFRTLYWKLPSNYMLLILMISLKNWKSFDSNPNHRSFLSTRNDPELSFSIVVSTKWNEPNCLKRWILNRHPNYNSSYLNCFPGHCATFYVGSLSFKRYICHHKISTKHFQRSNKLLLCGIKRGRNFYLNRV